MKTEFVSSNVNMLDGMLSVTVCIKRESSGGYAPRLGVIFTFGDKTRRMPLNREYENAEGQEILRYSNRFILSEIFFRCKAGDTTLDIIPENGERLDIIPEKAVTGDGIELRDGSFLIPKRLMNKKTPRSFSELITKDNIARLVFSVFNIYYKLYRRFHPTLENRITFMSGRRTSIDGNMRFVYDELKKDKMLDVKTLLFIQSSGRQLLKNTFAFMKLYATSRAVIVDDFFRLLSYFDKPEGTRVFQLWHACGAFKTFGYSRLGKVGAPSQRSANHRTYDYAFVSSREVARHYAEGFGISDSSVISTGVSRCDVFFDEDYKAGVKARFYEKYPILKDKKVLLFAPTFRGNGQQSAYYPTDKLNLDELCSGIGEEWAVIIKLHPFCKERFRISEELKKRVIDLSDEDELNDLLFITDLLVTDYSSAVFEASLLNIPMLFYAFDLEEYIKTRDFYYSFDALAPGKLVRSEEELISSIKQENFEKNKIKEFEKRFFDYNDSRSAERTAEFILNVIRG